MGNVSSGNTFINILLSLALLFGNIITELSLPVSLGDVVLPAFWPRYRPRRKKEKFRNGTCWTKVKFEATMSAKGFKLVVGGGTRWQTNTFWSSSSNKPGAKRILHRTRNQPAPASSGCVCVCEREKSFQFLCILLGYFGA